MPSQTNSQSEHGRRCLASLAPTVVKCREPAEVVLQVIGRDASEPGDPRFEPAVISVNVLDVPGPAHAFASAQVQGLMLQSHGVGGGRHRCRTIGAQNGVAVDAELQRLAQTGLGDSYQRRISCRAGAVSGHNHWDQVHATVLALFAPTAFARPSARALAFARAQKVGLVGLNHARQRWRLDSLRPLQLPVAPAKGGRGGHLQLSCRPVHAQALHHHLLLLPPLALHAQPGQGRRAQCVERATAGAVLVALQPAGTAVANHRVSFAMRTGQRRAQPRFQQRANILSPRWLRPMQPADRPSAPGSAAATPSSTASTPPRQSQAPDARNMGQSGQLWPPSGSWHEPVTNQRTKCPI